IHHIGVVCATLEEARHLFMDVYGLKVDAAHTPLPNGRYAANDTVRILEFPIGESRFEATVPQDETSGTARFLASRGPGIHHVCFYSDDIEHDATRLGRAGLQQIGTVAVAEGGRAKVVFFHPKSNGGILVELWQDVAGH
ncbi:MAG: VOC family protein, partial [Dehalococcoidia bacterium]|nr:VOC family protein [Dehalococcoidia bacterium]